MLYRGRNKKEFCLASLLYDAIEYMHSDSVKLLLTEKGADCNLILPKKGISSFHLVIGVGSYDFSIDVTNLMLQNGGDPNVRSVDGLTPVHIAAAWGRLELLQLLLQNGGDPEAKDQAGKTPMHYAIEENFTDCLNVLKAFLPCKNDLFLGEDAGQCSVVLDKILINTGHLIGEYNISPSTPTTEKPDSINLGSLPKTDATDLIMNWFSNQNQCSTISDDSRKLGESTSHSNMESSEGSLMESDCDNEMKRYDERFITFRKVYRKKRSKSTTPPTSPTTLPTSPTILSPNNTFYSSRCLSKESGVATLPSSIHEELFTSQKDREKSSDYLTCSSINSLEKNVFNLVEEEEEESFVSVSEVYKYEDKEEGVVLYERRLLKTPSEYARSVNSTNLSSLPPNFDFEVDSLRRELTSFGFSPGPITKSTKRIYLKKLYQLRKHPQTVVVKEGGKRVYCVELEKTLLVPDISALILPYRPLADTLSTQFASPDPSRKWREGINKSSFTYLLLDPRITLNLPLRSETLSPGETWKIFLQSIFYVGKGKRSRPYQHLYDAVQYWKTGQKNSDKTQRILDIWQSGLGVICLHVFLNVIPVEAFTREAAMIGALKLDNLTNQKAGEFYGLSATWPQKDKRKLGVFLLYKAMMIFLNEGERQLCPEDID